MIQRDFTTQKKHNWDFSGQKVDLIRNFSGI